MNFVTNVLSVRGSHEHVYSFFQAAKGSEPLYAPTDEDCENGTVATSSTISILCFHALVPVEGYFLDRPYSKASAANERDMWGCPNGAIEPRILMDVSSGKLTYWFETQYNAPHRLLQKVSSNHPWVRFYLTFADEAGQRGKCVYRGGGLEHCQIKVFENGISFGEPSSALMAWIKEENDSHEEWVNSLERNGKQ